MRAFKLTGIEKMELFQVPDPVIRQDNEVLVRMKRVGVCGSDIHYYTTGRIGQQVVQYPFTVGHEGSGLVEKTGPAVTRVKPGDKVAIDPAMPCFNCDQCKAGRFHTCRNLRFLGNPGQAEGCLSDFIVMPETSLFKTGSPLDYDEAALSEPLSIGFYALQGARPDKNTRMAVLGSGPIGMSVLLSAKAMGIEHIYMTDKIEDRLELVKRSGCRLAFNDDKEDIVTRISEQEPLLLDAVFEACGKQEAIDEAVQLLKPGGKLLIIGIPEFERWSFPVDALRHKEITLINVRRQLDCVEPVLDLMAKGRMQSKQMITHRFPFSRAREAFDLVNGYHDGVMKAMIDF